MTAVLVGRFEPGSPEWHAARAHGLGGSEVAPLLGLSPFESRFALWHRKSGLIGPVEENDVMDAGKRLEPAILQKFRDDHPEFAVVSSATYRHPDRPWQIGNPDGEIKSPCGCGSHLDGPPRGNGMAWCCDYNDCGPCCENCPTCPTVATKATSLVECKYALYDDHWGEPGTDEIPIWYRCQVQWYLDVFGFETCYVEVFIGSQGQFREYVVKADPTDQQALREAAVEFLAQVEREVRPDIDAHDQTYAVIKELHPLIEPRKVELPAELAVEFCQAKAAERAAKAAAQLATAKVADHMANAKTAFFVTQTIATRQARGEGLPYVVAARNLPTFNQMEAAS